MQSGVGRWHFGAALMLSGVGWNFMFVSGSSLLVAALPDTPQPVWAIKSTLENDFGRFQNVDFAGHGILVTIYWYETAFLQVAEKPLANKVRSPSSPSLSDFIPFVMLVPSLSWQIIVFIVQNWKEPVFMLVPSLSWQIIVYRELKRGRFLPQDDADAGGGGKSPAAVAGAGGSQAARRLRMQGEKTSFFAPFIYKMHYFTKTGSGQT
jgi:hypothetical protein